jgi:TRAP-type C4-dicarboxylate transport system permease small subunit
MTMQRENRVADVTVQDNRSVGQLVSDLVEDVRTLVKDQIALAKAELRSSAKAAAAGAVFILVAAGLLLLSLVFLLHAGAHGINAAGLPMWASYLIVGGSLLVIALIALAIAMRKMKKVNAPEHSKNALAHNVEAITPDH